jgi:ABC-type transport system involved in multi-copper enzyme maturation permease subunit/Na+-transporting methylmalonyl-CoA/oxaloacetate decarboxylase gamma subunit
MPLRFGPGPVFIHESIAACRRWQQYALRSLFLLGLLLALALVHYMLNDAVGSPPGSYAIRVLASLGEDFYYAIATVQLVLVLLVAPAATAGAICVDRTRGTLTHMMVTDLSNSEIVLGKLAARLLPVFALVGATVPLLALAGLLGGIIIEAIVTLTLITFAIAVLGCALALAFSVRATKVHEVLMAVYAIEAVWILGPLVWTILRSAGVPIGPPDWFVKINPFVLAWAPYDWSSGVGIESYAVALGAAVPLSAGLLAYSVLRLRAETTKGTSARSGTSYSWMTRARAWVEARRRSPSLDDDPILWREWRRGRPSRLARIIWAFYVTLASAGTAWGVFIACTGGDTDTIGVMSGFMATFGLLLVSIHAPTALAEERARGSLDVLMTTPVRTDRIVLAKWWGTYRVVPALAFLPAIGALVVGFVEPEIPRAFARSLEAHEPVGWIDRVAFVCLPTALFLAQGAVITSFGLALATWMRRLGRAIAASVAAYAIIAFGWVVSIDLEIVPSALTWLGLLAPDEPDADLFYTLIGASLCPFGGQLTPFQSVNWGAAASRIAFYIGHVIVLLLTIGVAFVFLGLTLATFNRSMGRMSERRRRAPRPPRAVQAASKPHKPESPAHEPVLAGLNA